MALQGTLADFGIAEILQLIGTQQKTGILHVEQEGADQAGIHISFLGGRIIRAELARPDRTDLLGNRLVAAEAISNKALEAALKTQRQGGHKQRLGELLVDQGDLDKPTLDEFLELQLREHLYRLFEWKNGRYRFESKPSDFTTPVARPVPAESILMEGFRMVDEWPLIRMRINNYDVVYKALKSLEDETDGADAAEALEKVLDDAFSEFLDDEPDMGGLDEEPAAAQRGPGSRLGDSERRIFDLVDGQRNVYRLIDMSRLGEFETCKALLTLLNEGYVEAVKEKPPQVRPVRRRSIQWGSLGRTALLNLLLLGSLVGGVLLMPRSPGQIKRDARLAVEELGNRLRANRVQAVTGALEIYAAEHGSYPTDLQALVDTRLLDPAVLDVPGDQRLDYVSIGTDYDLH